MAPDPMEMDVVLSRASTPTRRSEPVRLLVVDHQDMYSRQVLKHMLDEIKAGDDSPRDEIELEFLSHGEEAWERLRSGAIDIALVDDVSLNYAGFAAAAAKEGKVRETIMIACTADTSVGTDRLHALGVSDVLRKPLRVLELRHTLHKWLTAVASSVQSEETLRDTDLAPSTVPQADPGADLAPSTAVPSPAEKTSPILAAAPSPPPPEARFAGRVLLVEDDEITRLASDLIFQQLGICIDTAADGEEAMARLSRRDYDLILMDVNLPSISGYALVSWYKAMCEAEGRSVGYVVAVTADPDPETCSEFGMDKCLAKPLSTSWLSRALKDFWQARAV